MYQKRYNLNNLQINYENSDFQDQENFSTRSNRGDIEVVFKNLESELIRKINKADIIVGCVAWLTSINILSAMERKKAVAIVVQKEDFLRPDFTENKYWDVKLREHYNKLPVAITRYDTALNNTVLKDMSYAIDPDVAAVRCVGNHNSDKLPAFPRSHHKFIIFCKGKTLEENDKGDWSPYSVWTGSFNFTKNAGHSFENAIVVSNKKIVKAYLKEWAQIEALSEPLNWESKWCEPEWRIGS